MPFGLKVIWLLMVIQVFLQGGAVILYLLNPYPELMDMSDVPPVELVVAGVQALWTFWVVIGLWTRGRWVWYWMMLLMAYSLANGLRGYFGGEPSYINMFLNVLMVLYLNQSEVQQLFLNTHFAPTHSDPTHSDPTHSDPTHSDPTQKIRVETS